MSKIKAKYFVEKSAPLNATGTKFAFLIKKRLYSGRSPLQKIDVVELKFYGRTLFLDNLLQTSEGDGFIYHEMLCHPPLFFHPSPERVLIIGGGDGGSLAETLKHKKVKEVFMVEIDRKVVEVSKKYLPNISCNAFSDKRARLVIADGEKFITKYRNYFDVILLDLSDPDGPARELISSLFYRSVKKALRKNGIISVQSGCLTIQPKLVSLIFGRLNSIFKFVEVIRVAVPSYQEGELSFSIASDFNFPALTLNHFEKKSASAKLDLKYWSPRIFMGSKVMPKYLQPLFNPRPFSLR